MWGKSVLCMLMLATVVYAFHINGADPDGIPGPEPHMILASAHSEPESAPADKGLYPNKDLPFWDTLDASEPSAWERIKIALTSDHAAPAILVPESGGGEDSRIPLIREAAPEPVAEADIFSLRNLPEIATFANVPEIAIGQLADQTTGWITVAIGASRRGSDDTSWVVTDPERGAILIRFKVGNRAIMTGCANVPEGISNCYVIVPVDGGAE